MNKYRFTLGKKVDPTNLLTNGDFTGSATGWTLGSFWTYSANKVSISKGATVSADQRKYMVSQANVIYPNNFYYLEYKTKATTSGGGTGIRMAWSMGGTYSNYLENYDENIVTSGYTTFTHEYLFNPAGNDFKFWALSSAYGGTHEPNGELDDVVLYRYVWEESLEFDPLNWDSAKISKRRDETLNGLVINYIADVTFIKDGYDYLYAKYLSNGFCGEVPVNIEVLNTATGVYAPFFEGIIFISDCKFDITKRQVKVNIEDTNASLIFVRSKDVPVNMDEDSVVTLADYALITSAVANVPIDFNNDAGAYVYSNKNCYDISILLKRIIMKASNYRLDASSAFFTGDFNDYCIGLISELRGATIPENSYKISIKKLFEELNKICDLSFSVTTNSDGVPTIAIEDKISYLNSTSVLTLNRVNDVSFEFDKNNIFRSVNIGYEHIDDSATSTFKDDPEGDKYFTDNSCSEKKLDLVSDLIQNSSVLKRILDGTITNNKYDQYKFIIDTNGTQTNNSGSGTYDYNVNIEPADNMARWIETLQLGVLKSTQNSASILTKTNPVLDKIYSFKYPITKSQFDLMAQAYNTITFNIDGAGGSNISGYLLEANYEIRTGITDFKLLA